MPQTGDHARLDVKPWAGTIDQLIRAGLTAASRVAEAVPFPNGTDEEHPPAEPDFGQGEGDAYGPAYAAYRQALDEWHEAKRRREVEVRVMETGGYSRDLSAVDDLAELPVEDLPRIGLISMDIGGNGYTPTSARIIVSRRDGLEVRLAGLHRVWTAGVRHEVEEILAPRMRLSPPVIGGEDAAFAVGLGVFLVSFFGLAVLLRHAAHWSTGAALGVGFCVATFGAALVIATTFFPTMQVLAQGEKPRYQQLRSRILAAVGAFVVSVAAGVVVALAFPSSPAPTHRTSQVGKR